jgi:hypothetical protein
VRARAAWAVLLGGFAMHQISGQLARWNFHADEYAPHQVDCRGGIERPVTRRIGNTHPDCWIECFRGANGDGVGQYFLIRQAEANRLRSGAVGKNETSPPPFGKRYELAFEPLWNDEGAAFSVHQVEFGENMNLECWGSPSVDDLNFYCGRVAALHGTEWRDERRFSVGSEPRPVVSKKILLIEFISLNGSMGSGGRCLSSLSGIIHARSHVAQLNEEQQGLTHPNRGESEREKTRSVLEQPSPPPAWFVPFSLLLFAVGLGGGSTYLLCRLVGIWPTNEKHTGRKNRDSQKASQEKLRRSESMHRPPPLNLLQHYPFKFHCTSGTLFASHKLPLRGYLAAIAVFATK